MEVVYQRCAGLDVHQHTVVACARFVEKHKVHQEVETFKTTVKELAVLKTWLLEHGCTHAAIESTGVYWRPVWQALEGALELVLANAHEVRSLPGRKSDINDATWLADLMAHGLIRGSFVPSATVQALRELSRTRTQLKREVTRHTQRIQKALETAGVKLTGLISDVLGATGRAILAALIAGETDPDALAQLKRQGIRASHEQLRDALQGRLLQHHRLLLKLHLEQVDTLELAIREIEARMGELLDPFRSHVELLKTVPGIQEVTARLILAEIGFDPRRFPTAGHLVSWAGLCPGSDESAGKQRSTRIEKGSARRGSTSMVADHQNLRGVRGPAPARDPAGGPAAARRSRAPSPAQWTSRSRRPPAVREAASQSGTAQSGFAVTSAAPVARRLPAERLWGGVGGRPLRSARRESGFDRARVNNHEPLLVAPLRQVVAFTGTGGRLRRNAQASDLRALGRRACSHNDARRHPC
jgi:transposase